MSKNCSHPQYEQKSDRLITFEKWYLDAVKSPNELAEAGFFYTGVRDEVRCFSCGIGLKDWCSYDDAWEQHACWSPNCNFIRQNRGTLYIAQVQDKFHKTIDFENICKICYDNVITILYRPCGHAITCDKCSLRIPRCPLCRQNINQRINIE